MQREWLIKYRGTEKQSEVAAKSGISRSHYAQIESGNRTPSVKVAKRIATVLGFDWVIFFDNQLRGMCNKHRAG